MVNVYATSIVKVKSIIMLMKQAGLNCFYGCMDQKLCFEISSHKFLMRLWESAPSNY